MLCCHTPPVALPTSNVFPTAQVLLYSLLEQKYSKHINVVI